MVVAAGNEACFLTESLLFFSSLDFDSPPSLEASFSFFISASSFFSDFSSFFFEPLEELESFPSLLDPEIEEVEKKTVSDHAGLFSHLIETFSSF